MCRIIPYDPTVKALFEETELSQREAAANRHSDPVFSRGHEGARDTPSPPGNQESSPFSADPEFRSGSPLTASAKRWPADRRSSRPPSS